jgi:anti-sigma factor RsiW
MGSVPTACAARVPLLSAMADGELAPGRAASLNKHLLSCAVCTARLALLKAQSAALHGALVSRVDALDLGGFTDRVLAKVETDRARPRLRDRAQVISLELWAANRRVFSAAAGLAVAASLLFGVFLRQAARPPELLAQASVDLLEFDGQTGAVIEVPGQTTVIWVSDEVAQ